MFKQKHPSLDPSTKQLTFLNKFCFLTIHVDYKLEISSIHANTCQINFYFPCFEVDSANNFTLIRLKPRQTSSTEREKEGEREKSSSLTIFRSIFVQLAQVTNAMVVQRKGETRSCRPCGGQS